MAEREELKVARLSTPLGELVLVTDERAALLAVDWGDCEARMRSLLTRAIPSGFTLYERSGERGLCDVFAGYFAGDLRALEALAVAPRGSTFQRSVWTALRALPAGTTTSYGALAARLGQPRAARAVGLANSQNPLSLVVPCHRVVGASGALTGYAGGLPRKRWLLAHEARHTRAVAHEARA